MNEQERIKREEEDEADQLRFVEMAGNPEFENCSIFIGNTPYNAREDQVVKICEEIGPIVYFKLGVDSESGRSRGYAFCEYRDGETAASAFRNLKGCMLMGRELKVSLARSGWKRRRQTQISAHEKPIGGPTAIAAQNVMAQLLGFSQPSSLTIYLSQMSETQLTKFLSDFKESLATLNEEQAQEVLLANPNDTTALLQAHIMLGLMTPQMTMQFQNIQQSLVQTAQDQSGVPTCSSCNQQMQPMSQNAALEVIMQELNAEMQLPADVSTSLLEQVLNLTRQQIRSLSPDHQRQVIQLQLQHKMGLPLNLYLAM